MHDERTQRFLPDDEFWPWVLNRVPLTHAVADCGQLEHWRSFYTPQDQRGNIYSCAHSSEDTFSSFPSTIPVISLWALPPLIFYYFILSLWALVNFFYGQYSLRWHSVLLGVDKRKILLVLRPWYVCKGFLPLCCFHHGIFWCVCWWWMIFFFDFFFICLFCLFFVYFFFFSLCLPFFIKTVIWMSWVWNKEICV